MKRVLSMLLTLLLCASVLAGCGKEKDKPVSNLDTDRTANEDRNTNTTDKIHSTGDFSFVVPRGWLEIPFVLNGEDDPTAAGIYKGARNEFDILSTPGIQINCPSSGARIAAKKNDFDSAADIEPLKLDNYTWEGFTGEKAGVPYAILWDSDKKDDFQITVFLEAGKRISLNDKDVLSIIGSIMLERKGAVGGESPAAETADIEGRYQMIAYDVNGESMFEYFAMWSGSDFDATGLYLELKSDGACVLAVDEEPLNGTYKIEGSVIEIDIEGQILNGTLASRKITIEVEESDEAMVLIFEKDGIAPVITYEPPYEDDTESAAQEIWNGIWYGYMWITEFYGAYEGSENDLFDAFMEIDIDEDGEGTMYIYSGFMNQYYTFDELSDFVWVESDIIADEYHFEVTEGQIIDDYGNMSLDPAVWWLGLSPTWDEPAIVISDTFFDYDDDGYDFMFIFRPYGAMWEDQLGSGSNKRIPPGYEGYIAELSENASASGGSPLGFPEGGDGMLNMTYEQLEEALDEISDLSWFGSEDVTYEIVVEYFGGVEGRFDEVMRDTILYEWFATDKGGGYLTFSDEDGVLIYEGYSISQYITP